MWVKEAIGYQIYPKSFNDSNGDGIGDIKGIIEKLDYFLYLGVDLLWLGPIYKSPMDDNGYDVSDFFEIAPEYGTMDDFKNLLTSAHAKGIRICMDLVLNHTSDEHPWFLESRKSVDNPYREYYIWQKGRMIDGKEVEPTNWASFFGGSAWKKDSATGEYYMKIFSNKMPDLNWESKKMRDDLYKMVDWWASLGIDGFRVDAVAHLERAPFVDADPEKFAHSDGYVCDWRMFSNMPKVFTYLEELHQVVKPHNMFMVGEVGGGATLNEALEYVGYGKNRLDMVFTFDHNFHNDAHNSLMDAWKPNLNLESLKDSFARFQTGLYNKSWHALYWLNHDHPRVMTMYGDVNKHNLSGKMLANTLYFMWGTPFVYNGEEIGMTNGDFKSIEDYRDVSAINTYNSLIKHHPENHVLTHLGILSRDHARTPMQWTAGPNAGFTTGKPWIKVNDNHSWLNVEQEIADPNSILNHYKRVFSLRKEYKMTILEGSFTLLESETFAYLRSLDKTLLVISNFFDKEIVFEHVVDIAKVLLQNYEDIKLIDGTLYIRPFESLVIEVK